MTDQELFEKLKQETECWHTFDNKRYSTCTKCGQEECVRDIQYIDNPDFSTPDGIDWLRKRCLEKGIESTIRTTISFDKTTYVEITFNDYKTQHGYGELIKIESPDFDFSIQYTRILKRFLNECN